MRIRFALVSLVALALFGGAHAAVAGSPVQSAEDAAEAAWETYVAAATATPMSGTLSCAVSDSDGAMVATCFALVAAEDGSVASVIVGRSTSTDGATFAEFVPVPVGAAPGDGAVANPAAGGFAMPDAVGMDLQQAQDLLQQVSDEMLYYSSSEDATGEGRMQLIDSNWIVCSQNVAPGATVTADLNVIFAVVKDDETCP